MTEKLFVFFLQIPAPRHNHQSALKRRQHDKHSSSYWRALLLCRWPNQFFPRAGSMLPALVRGTGKCWGARRTSCVWVEHRDTFFLLLHASFVPHWYSFTQAQTHIMHTGYFSCYLTHLLTQLYTKYLTPTSMSWYSLHADSSKSSKKAAMLHGRVEIYLNLP